MGDIERDDERKMLTVADFDRVIRARDAALGEVSRLNLLLSDAINDKRGAVSRVAELEAENARLLSEIADVHAMYGVGGSHHHPAGGR